LEGLTLKQLTLGTIILLTMVILVSYTTIPVHASEPSLIEIFNSLGFPHVSETTMETFPAEKYCITLYAEFSETHNKNELSRYELNINVYTLLFTGPEGNYGYVSPPITKNFTANYDFSLTILSKGYRYVTETFKNPDGEKHAKVYVNLDNPRRFLIGFEDSYGGGDEDYNDMVFAISTESLPVGGVEAFISESAIATPFACYSIILGAFCIATSLVKRKLRT